MHPRGLVHVVEVRLCARADGPERRRLAGERDGAADEDRGGRDAGILGWTSARSGSDDERDEPGAEQPARHFETCLRRPGTVSTAFPTRTRAVGGIGRSRYRRFDGDCASEDDARVSVNRDPRGTKVA